MTEKSFLKWLGTYEYKHEEIVSVLSLSALPPPDAGGLVRALAHFSHLTADTIINGSATAHMAPTDHADRKEMLRPILLLLVVLILHLLPLFCLFFFHLTPLMYLSSLSPHPFDPICVFFLKKELIVDQRPFTFCRTDGELQRLCHAKPAVPEGSQVQEQPPEGRPSFHSHHHPENPSPGSGEEGQINYFQSWTVVLGQGRFGTGFFFSFSSCSKLKEKKNIYTVFYNIEKYPITQI